MSFWNTTMTSSNPFDTLRNNRRRASQAGRLSFILAIVLVCGAVLYWRDPLAAMLWRVLSPVALVRDKVEQNKVTALEAELASTSAMLADRTALAEQNAELKLLLGRPQTSTEVLGAVLLRPPGLPYDTLMIDAGTAEGAAVGDIVFGGGSAAIGEITDAYSDTSRVTLFSAPGRSYDAEVAPAATPGSVIPVSLQGEGAGSLEGQIPSGSAVAVGDPVVVPGIGNDFMGGISHIDEPSGSSFQTLYVQLPVDIFSLQYVEVQTHL